MSAPLVWVVLPLLLAGLLWLLRRYTGWTLGLATGGSFLFMLTAAFLPLESASATFTGSFQLGSTLTVLGRRLVLTSDDRAFLVILYGFAFFWFVGSFVVGVHRYFPAHALAIVALLVAAFAVEPFLYAALFVEIAVLVSIPLFIPPGKKPGVGVLRYLIFQTLAVPFILFAGWASAVVDANPANAAFLQITVIILGLGMAFWLAVFPFYTWMPLIAAESDPYVAGFILILLPIVALLLVLDFFNAFTWLREYPILPFTLRVLGVLMVVTGGVWAAFQDDLARLFGYGVILENGFALLAISLPGQSGLPDLMESFLARIAALALWALGLSVLRRYGIRRLQDSQGMLHRLPLVAVALVTAGFSLAGLPLLAGFPFRAALLQGLVQVSPLSALWALVGVSGYFLGTFRMLAAMAHSEQKGWKLEESRPQAVLLVVGILGVLAVGVLPRVLSGEFLSLLQAFERLR